MGGRARASFSGSSICPPETLRGDGLARAHDSVAISGVGGSVATAIEQFDLQSTDALMWGYDEGWHEAEYNPALGVWRWTSERATLRIVGASSPLVDHSPRRAAAQIFRR